MLKLKILNLFRNFGWMLACYFVFFTFLGILNSLFPQIDLQRYQQTEILELLEGNPWKFVLLAVIIAPVLEEGMFRTLIRPSPNELIFFICCWIWILSIGLIPDDVSGALKYSFLVLLLIISFLFLKEFISVRIQFKLCLFLKRYYLLVWGITAVIFGIVHIFNYVEGFELNFVLILLIFPRVIAGYFFGKIKIENRGLFWPITMHAMNNSIVLLFLLPRLL